MAELAWVACLVLCQGGLQTMLQKHYHAGCQCNTHRGMAELAWVACLVLCQRGLQTMLQKHYHAGYQCNREMAENETLIQDGPQKVMRPLTLLKLLISSCYQK